MEQLNPIVREYGTRYAGHRVSIRDSLTGNPLRLYPTPNPISPYLEGEVSLDATGQLAVYVGTTASCTVTLYDRVSGYQSKVDTNVEPGQGGTELTLEAVHAGAIGQVFSTADGELIDKDGARLGGPSGDGGNIASDLFAPDLVAYFNMAVN